MSKLENLENVIEAFNFKHSVRHAKGIHVENLNDMTNLDSDRLFFFINDEFRYEDDADERIALKAAEQELISLGRSIPDYDEDDLEVLDTVVEQIRKLTGKTIDIRRIDQAGVIDIAGLIKNTARNVGLSELLESSQSTDEDDNAPGM